MKKEVGSVSALPSKRLFLSIIADYDLQKSICELIDNALDTWVKKGREEILTINIICNIDQQTITIIDNAEGLKKENLRFVVGPGQTLNEPIGETIGIFGVGTKRAVVALAQDIQITTRYKNKKTYRVEFDESWLNAPEDWELPVYDVDQIDKGTTIVELKKLRIILNEEGLIKLQNHLKATYAKFLKNENLILKLNKVKIIPLLFNDWAYPPEYHPREYVTQIETEDGSQVKVNVIAGLSLTSSPATGEYGVYFYCNDRLISRAIKDYHVGFVKGLAGKPHAKFSLTRVIVSMNGEAQKMPWNSSKSGINYDHPVFIAVQDLIFNLVKYYSSLSSRLVGEIPKRVSKFSNGEIEKIAAITLPKAKKLLLPPLPRARLRYGEKIDKANKKIAKEKPWTKGLYESIIGVDIIYHKKLEQKNRICLILLDSTLEIAFKEFLVNESGNKYSNVRLVKLFQRRYTVEDEVKQYITLKENTWRKIHYYYQKRCELVHQKTTSEIKDSEIDDFREVVEKVLKKLFKLKFKK